MALRPHPGRPWTPEEREWALECLRERDSPQEIADWANRPLMDVLTEFDMLTTLRMEQAWRKSTKYRQPGHMVGRMLKVAVAARLAAGEEPSVLAKEAGVKLVSIQCAMRKMRKDEAAATA